MLWDDIAEIVQSRLDEDFGDNNRFTPYRFRMVSAMVQKDISERVHCIEGADGFVTVAGTKAYDLPGNALDVFNVIYDTSYVEKTGRDPLNPNNDRGVPEYYWQTNQKIGFYLIPSDAKTVQYWYYRSAPGFAFSIKHTPDTACTSAQIAFNTASIVFTAVGGADSGVTTINTTDVTTDTMAEIVTKLNTKSTLNAKLNPWAYAQNAYGGAGVELRTINIFNRRDLCMLNPEIPSQGLNALVEGIVYEFKYKDRELEFAGTAKGLYEKEVERFRVNYRMRDFSQKAHKIKKRGGLFRSGRIDTSGLTFSP